MALVRLLALVGAAGLVSPSGADQKSERAGARWLGPDGNVLPFTSDEEVLDFLRTARMVDKTKLSTGSTRPWKVRLERGGVEANAIFRYVDVKKRRAFIDRKLHVRFHDGYAYECAAYELSRLLGLDRVPPCVTRSLERTPGSLQLWIEQASSATEGAGAEADLSMSWFRQQQVLLLFDALIHNIDRNQGNKLVDSRGKLWLIDHTRSFLPSRTIENLDDIVWCERDAWERLLALDEIVLGERLGGYLQAPQLAMLLDRRDQLVDHLSKRIATHGEGGVLFEWKTGESGGGG